MGISSKMKDLDYLELSSNPLRFEAVNQLTNVFFDDSNKEVRNLICLFCSCFLNLFF